MITYITSRWIGDILPLMISKILFWTEEDKDDMLNERDEEVWCSLHENGTDCKKKHYGWGLHFPLMNWR